MTKPHTFLFKYYCIMLNLPLYLFVFFYQFQSFCPLSPSLFEISYFFVFLEGIFTQNSVSPSRWCNNLDPASCMDWESALAADVEHMPLMIHTVCGRSLRPANLVPLPRTWTPSPFLVCYVLFVLFFFLHKGKIQEEVRLCAVLPVCWLFFLFFLSGENRF